MRMTSVQLNCFGGQPSYGPSGIEQHVYANADLGASQDFIAWTTIGYVNGLGGGDWNLDNAFYADIFSVDGQPVDPTAYGAKMGFLGHVDNLRRTSLEGYGRFLAFRLIVFRPQEMEVSANGIILHGF